MNAEQREGIFVHDKNKAISLGTICVETGLFGQLAHHEDIKVYVCPEVPENEVWFQINGKKGKIVNVG